MKNKIIKEFLNKEELYFFKLNIESNRFPWFYKKPSLINLNPRFIHPFYNNHEYISLYGEIADIFLKKIESEALIKIEAVLLPRTAKQSKYSIDVKNKLLKNQFLLIYAINKIKLSFNSDELETELKENEAIVFKAQEPCEIYEPIDTKKNMFIYFNFII